MPSEQPPAYIPSSTRQGLPEQRQDPPFRGGVRMLLGLPFRDSGAPSTAALATPSGRHRYGQSPLPAPEESDESFGETAPDGGVVAEARSAGADFPERDSTPFSRVRRENAADARSTRREPSAEQREQTRLVIPGVSTHRTDFPALSRTVDTPTISVEGDPLHASPPPAAPLNPPVPLSRAREMTTSNVELLARLEQLVTVGARGQQSSEAWSRASTPLSPGPLEPMGRQYGERGGQDLAQRFEQLQRTVHDLAVTVSSQAARNRDESQAQRRERQTLAPQRMGIMKRSEGPPTTPGAFWERSRLGRFYLKTGR
jgi:hypothetical protein